MRARLIAAFTVCGVCLASIGGAQTPASSSSTTSPWTWRPSVFVLGSADDNDDPPVGAPAVMFEQPEFASNLGAGVDGSTRTRNSRTSLGAIGLVRSPLSSSNRSMYLSSRLNFGWQFAQTWRMNVSDNAKIQHRPALDAADFQRNNASLDLEWRPQSSSVGLTFDVSDRRRALHELAILNFERQSAGVGVVASNATLAAEARVSLQPYHAPTATGSRLVVSGELAKFGRSTLGSLRYSFVEPMRDRRREYESSAEGAEFGDIDRVLFLEELGSSGSDVLIAADLLAIEPVDTDSDDWDFGRRKHVLDGYVSRSFPGGAVVSGSIRFQHRTGPNLLVPADSPSAVSFHDERLTLRGTYRQTLTNRLTFVAQASMLRSTGDRPIVNFSRPLLGIGVQIHF